MTNPFAKRPFSRIPITLFGLLVLAACDGGAVAPTLPPTATLAPIVSATPRFTATPIPSSTPLPTETLTPSLTPIPPTETQTFTPSPTPPVVGSVVSAQDVNIREGPDVSFPAINALRPGTELLILGFSEDGRWLNIRLTNGDEGWISAALVRIRPTPTPIPSLTPTPDPTLMAQLPALPTALLGGDPVTPTPPPIAVTATPPTAQAATLSQPTGVNLPNIDAIRLTATALAGIGLPVLATSETTPTPITTVNNAPPPTTDPSIGGPAGGPLITPSSAAPTASGPASTQSGADILAYCDDRSYGSPPPTNLAAGSTVDIFWSWFAQTREQLDDHRNAVIYDVRLDGERLANWRAGAQPVTVQDGLYYQYWYVPVGPLTSGPHVITYTVTWERAISDGFDQFGPGTANPRQTGTCTFTVR